MKGGAPLIDDNKDRLRRSTFFQLDGRVSTPISVGARLVGGGADLFPDDENVDVRVGDVELTIRDLPAIPDDDDTAPEAAQIRSNADAPSFRFRAELIQDETINSAVGGAIKAIGDMAKGIADAISSVITFTPAVKVELGQISGGLDFKPTTAAAARRVDLVLHTDGALVHVDLISTSRIEADFGQLNAHIEQVPINFEVRARAEQLDASVFSQVNLIGDQDYESDGLEDLTTGGLNLLDTLLNTVKDTVLGGIEGVVSDACQKVLEFFGVEKSNDDDNNFNSRDEICGSFSDFMDKLHDFDITNPFTGEVISVAKAIEDFVTAAASGVVRLFEGLLNAVPIGAQLKSKLEVTVGLRHVSRLDFRLNMLHGEIRELWPETGSVQVGPINWFLEDLSAGWYFYRRTSRSPTGSTTSASPARSSSTRSCWQASPTSARWGWSCSSRRSRCSSASAAWWARSCRCSTSTRGSRAAGDDTTMRHNFFVWPFSGSDGGGIIPSGILIRPLETIADALLPTFGTVPDGLTETLGKLGSITKMLLDFPGESLRDLAVAGAICLGLPTDKGLVRRGPVRGLRTTTRTRPAISGSPPTATPPSRTSTTRATWRRTPPSPATPCPASPSRTPSPPRPEPGLSDPPEAAPSFEIEETVSTFDGFPPVEPVVITIDDDVALCGRHEVVQKIPHPKGGALPDQATPKPVRLQINAAITVAADVSGARWTEGDNTAWCPAGSEGRLELVAHSIEVFTSGGIVASGCDPTVSAACTIASGSRAVNGPGIGPNDDLADPGDNVPDLVDLLTASGSSGGSNGGVGHRGSSGSPSTRPFDRGNDLEVAFTGGAGCRSPPTRRSRGRCSASCSPRSWSRAPIPPGPEASAGAVILRATDTIVVKGTVVADGANGAGSSAGECDDDEFEDPGNDGTVDDGPDEDTEPDVVLVSDDPPFEHTGADGSGGGAGGTILFRAGHRVDVSGASISATGGNGGDGETGAGGAGGGGVVKLIAPKIDGDDTGALTAAVRGGFGAVAGDAIAGDGEVRCDGPEAPSAVSAPPIDVRDRLADDRPVLFSKAAPPQPFDGVVKIVRLPDADVSPPANRWNKPAPAPTVKLRGAGGPGPVTVYVCAVLVPDSEADPGSGTDGLAIRIQGINQSVLDPGIPENLFLLPVMPRIFHTQALADAMSTVVRPTGVTASRPCGTTEGADDRVGRFGELERTFGKDAGGAPLAWVADVTLNPPGASDLPPGEDRFDDIDLPLDAFTKDGFYGIWTTAVSGSGATAVIEPFDGVETVIGVDGAAPTVSNVAVREVARPGQGEPPDNDGVISTDRVAVTFRALDQRGLSGLLETTCSIVIGPEEHGPQPCDSGDVIDVPLADGDAIVRVTATDEAGNVTVTDKAIFLDTGLPETTITFEGGVLGCGGPNGCFYRVSPDVVLTAEAVDLNDAVPFAYRFDDGLTRTCKGTRVTSEAITITLDPAPPFPLPPEIPGERKTCRIPAAEVDLLFPGAHLVKASAVTSSGIVGINLPVPQSVAVRELKVDREAPEVAVATVPARHDLLPGRRVVRRPAVPVRESGRPGRGFGPARGGVHRASRERHVHPARFRSDGYH